MTKEEKQLLLKDICARLTYNPYIFIKEDNIKTLLTSIEVDKDGIAEIWYSGTPYSIEDVKPYLRLMSSMTEKEKEELFQLMGGGTDVKRIDFYISHHFDYRGLIEKGLALEAPENMYNFN